MNTPDLLHWYTHPPLGFDLLFWLRGHERENWKGPREKGWNDKDRRYPLDIYTEGHNVGVFTGHELAPNRFLADIDFDVPFDNGFAALLPETKFIFGRPSKPITHAFYTTSTPMPVTGWEDLDGKKILEVRGASPTKRRSHQTMIPPSLHPSGERLEFRVQDVPGHTEQLLTVARNWAICYLLGQHLGQRQLGHDPRLALAGFLIREQLTEQEVVAIIQVLCQRTGNDAEGGADIPAVVQSTARKILSGDRKVTGAPKFIEHIGGAGQRLVERIREWLRGDSVGGILLVGGQASAIVDRAEGALLTSTTPIYQRGGALVRPVKVDTATGDTAVRRAVGATMLIAVLEPWLSEQMGRVLHWFRPSKDGKRALVDPPARYARTLLGRQGEWTFPTLRGIVSAPTLARNGRILETPGFDRESGLLLDFAAGTFPPLLPFPTLDDARDALAHLVHPLRGFPFDTGAAQSVTVSALLTALIRPSLGTAPLHAFDAPAAGTGKSKLAEIVGLVSTGHRPPAMSQGKTAEEDEKRWVTVLMAGDPVIHLDNIEQPLGGDFLCSVLTGETVSVRVLGFSERRVIPSTALILASGNNLVLKGDITRRAIVCRLDAKVERPDERQFNFDCVAEVRAYRPSLVAAGLTILRAYHVARRPLKLTPMGSFEDWSNWVRAALVWLGCADPAQTRDSLFESNPDKDELVAVMELWAETFPNGERVVVKAIPTHSADLAQLLAEAASDGKAQAQWTPKKIGWWLRRHKERVVGDRCFRSAERGGRQEWWLAERRGDGSFSEGKEELRPSFIEVSAVGHPRG